MVTEEVLKYGTQESHFSVHTHESEYDTLNLPTDYESGDQIDTPTDTPSAVDRTSITFPRNGKLLFPFHSCAMYQYYYFMYYIWSQKGPSTSSLFISSDLEKTQHFTSTKMSFLALYWPQIDLIYCRMFPEHQLITFYNQINKFLNLLRISPGF